MKLTGMAKGLKDMKRFLDNLIKSDVYDEVLLFEQAEEDNKDAASGIRFSIELLGAF